MQGEFLSIETAQKVAKADKLEKNWNELKKWLEIYLGNVKSRYYNSHPSTQYSLEVTTVVLAATINKMEELEGQK